MDVTTLLCFACSSLTTVAAPHPYSCGTLCLAMYSCIHVFLTYVHMTPLLLMMLYMCWWESLTECAAMYIDCMCVCGCWGRGDYSTVCYARYIFGEAPLMCMCAGVYISICIAKHITGMWLSCCIHVLHVYMLALCMSGLAS